MERMKQLIFELNRAAEAYYRQDAPIMSDKQYDALYDELTALEEKSGTILSNSPTQKVQGQLLDGFAKVQHSRPMLSAQKTKQIDEIEKFVDNQEVLISWKLDGLTIVLIYENGQLQQGVTRGDGEVGEDVTASVRMFENIPLNIPYKGRLELRGEGVLSYSKFEAINALLEVPYSSARNLAAGTVRQLNTGLVRERGIHFLAFQLVEAEQAFTAMQEEFVFLEAQGFDVVTYKTADKTTVAEQIHTFQPEEYNYPVDGVIVSYNDLAYGNAKGETAHHPNSMIALKWADATKETTLLDIELNPTRTGRVSLTAVFEPVEIDGAMLRRATLHNVDIMERYHFGIGDRITVYRSNMVIPAVDENLTQSGTYQLPSMCPCCGTILEIKAIAETRELFCPNVQCPAKQVRRFTHFVSKHGMNIEGLSEQTLEKMIDAGLIHEYADIFSLIEHHGEQIKTMDGFGEKSVANLQKAIEKSATTRLDKFLTALGIPNLGRASCKTLAAFVEGSWDQLVELLETKFDFTALDDFGEIMNQSLYAFYQEEEAMLTKLVPLLNFEPMQSSQNMSADNPFAGKTIVATGKLNYFTRDSIKEKIERLGAKAASSVSAKTDYVLAGEKAGSKLSKAEQLGVAIISEDTFLEMLGETADSK